MTNRTVQIYGYGFGSTDATINVTQNGNVIFNGTVTTANQPVPELPNLDLDNETVPLYSFDVPVDFAGVVPMACEVTNGTVVFCQIKANYSPMRNPVFNDAEWAVLTNPNSTNQEMYDIVAPHASPSFTQEETDTLLNPSTSRYNFTQICNAHNVSAMISSGATGFQEIYPDPRSNVYIDQGKQPVDHDTYPGTWWWKVENGSTLTYDLNLTAGTE